MGGGLGRDLSCCRHSSADGSIGTEERSLTALVSSLHVFPSSGIEAGAEGEGRRDRAVKVREEGGQQVSR